METLIAQISGKAAHNSSHMFIHGNEHTVHIFHEYVKKTQKCIQRNIQNINIYIIYKRIYLDSRPKGSNEHLSLSEEKLTELSGVETAFNNEISMETLGWGVENN